MAVSITGRWFLQPFAFNVQAGPETPVGQWIAGAYLAGDASGGIAQFQFNGAPLVSKRYAFSLEGVNIHCVGTGGPLFATCILNPGEILLPGGFEVFAHWQFQLHQEQAGAAATSGALPASDARDTIPRAVKGHIWTTDPARASAYPVVDLSTDNNQLAVFYASAWGKLFDLRSRKQGMPQWAGPR